MTAKYSYCVYIYNMYRDNACVYTPVMCRQRHVGSRKIIKLKYVASFIHESWMHKAFVCTCMHKLKYLYINNAGIMVVYIYIYMT